MSRKYAIGQAIPDPISEGLGALRDALKSRALMQQQQQELDLKKQGAEREQQKYEAENAPINWDTANLVAGGNPQIQETLNKLRYGGSGMSPEEYKSKGLAEAPTWQGVPAPESGVNDQEGLAKYASALKREAPTEGKTLRPNEFKNIIAGAAAGNKEELAGLKSQNAALQGAYNQARTEAIYNKMDNPAGAFGGALNLRTTAMIGDKYNKDKILNQVDSTINSLNRAQAITNGDIPVTAQTWNIAQQDFINAVAQGGRATEGKVNRELVHTFFDRVNEWLGKGGQISDLRKAEPQLFDQFQKQIDLIKDDYNDVGRNRVYQVGQGLLAAGKLAPPVLQASNDTKAAYYERYGGPHPKDTTFMEYAKQSPGAAPAEKPSAVDIGKLNQKMRTALADPRAKDPAVRQQLLDHYKFESGGKDYGQ